MGVSQTWFALDGWAHVLYWLHDHVVLHAIGHLWTRFFPYSLVWCVLLAAAFALLLTGLCTHRSLLQPLHIRATRFMLHRRSMCRLIGFWCRAVGAFSWGWQQIAGIVEFEFDVAVDKAVRLGSRNGIDRAMQIGRLYAEISLAIGQPQRHGIGALQALYECVALQMVFGKCDLRDIPRAHRRLLALLLDRAVKNEQAQLGVPLGAGHKSLIEMIRALIDTHEFLRKDSVLATKLIQELSDFITGLDRRVAGLQRQRRTHLRRAVRETEPLTEISIRLRFLHALVVSTLAEEVWPAEAVLVRLEGYLLLQTLSAVPVADEGCIRSRDFAYVLRLIELHGTDEADAIESVRTLDDEIFSAHDLNVLKRSPDVLEQAAFSERKSV